MRIPSGCPEGTNRRRAKGRAVVMGLIDQSMAWELLPIIARG
jgi:hypothetical protein